MRDLKEGISNAQSVMKQWFEKANEQVRKKKLEQSFKDLVKVEIAA